MDNVKEQTDFTVAVLTDDIHHAKEVSGALREMGIYAHVYQNLDDFWVAANTHTPDLAIIDVKCMSSGSLILRNHPKVLDNTLSFCFLYKNATRTLLNSTKSMGHYGLINMDVELTAQIQTTLYNRNRQLQIEDKNKTLSDRVDRLQKRSARIMTEVQESYNFENQFQKLENIVERLGSLKGSDNFNARLATIFEMWDECKCYSIYEVNQTGQKLISPKLGRKKYKEMPDLWLTKNCEQGMEPFALEMAEEVAFDLYDGEVRCLKINGRYDRAEILIMGTFKDENLEGFQWQWLERYLNGMYTQLALRVASNIQVQTQEMTTFECMDYMDDLHYHHAKVNHKIFTVNFAPMLDWISQNGSNRFFWKAFHADYTHQLKSMLNGNFKLSNYGIHSYIVMIDLKQLERDFNALRHFVSEFHYWRYFEDSTIVMQKDVVPQIKTIAPSAVSLLRTVQGQTQKVVTRSDANNKEVFRDMDIR